MPWTWLDITLPVLATVFAWWLSTGLVFMAVRGARDRHAARFLALSVLSAVALATLWLLRDQNTVASAYLAFLSALTIWAWQEAGFLMGYITGPRLERLQARAGIRHFADAAMAIIYHELALAAGGLLLLVLLWDASNWVGVWTYTILWAMRLSAKLNIFLGVHNLAEELLPDHLRFLRPYFCKRPINFLFPISITVPTVIAGSMLGHLWFATPDLAQLTATAILGTLLALAILEHWFLILPVPDTALWRWATAPAEDASQRPPPGPVRVSAS